MDKFHIKVCTNSFLSLLQKSSLIYFSYICRIHEKDIESQNPKRFFAKKCQTRQICAKQTKLIWRKLAGIGRRKKTFPIPPKIKPECPLMLDMPDVEEPNILLRTSPTRSPRSSYRSLEFNFDANYEENEAFEAELPNFVWKRRNWVVELSQACGKFSKWQDCHKACYKIPQNYRK